MYQNGSITDGLSAWRKNVTGALKGQVSILTVLMVYAVDADKNA